MKIIILLLIFNFAYSVSIFPKALKKGDTVAITASASTVEDKNLILDSKKMLENMGFKVMLGNHIFEDLNYSPTASDLAQKDPFFAKNYTNSYVNLAGSDKHKAEDLMEMFKNPKVKAIIEFRGGYGSGRILDLINYEEIKSHPKIFIGYSDITALLLAINKQTGLVTFHGPLASKEWDEFTIKYFEKVVMNNSKNLKFNEYVPVVDDDGNLVNLRFVINSGVAQGELVGGNLTVLSTLLGTKYQPDFNNKILFIEDVNEKQLYKIDRIFAQLKNSGALHNLKGFIFASCSDCNLTSFAYYQMQQIFDTYIKPLNIPAFYGAMIGHLNSKFTIPIGVMAEINANNASITLLNSATK